MTINLSTMQLHIGADRRLVFQMLSAFDSGVIPGPEGSSKVLSRDGNRLVVEFLTPVNTPIGRRSIRTVEEVALFEPERIMFNALEGPLSSMEEEFQLSDREGCTTLKYDGRFIMPWRLFGWLIGRLYVKGAIRRVVWEHMVQIKQAAEARASRSKLFPSACSHKTSI
jgi:hypothetical protein